MADSAQKPVVLLVEDEWLVRMEIADALLEAGWEVLEISSGEAAVAHIAGGHALDLLVSDIRLTGPVNGWDVAEACRAAHPAIPVVYASANPCDRDRMVKDSVFLSKPSRTEQLVSLCRNLYERKAK
ncbi:MAG: response regulator [Rhizomicrobium sp.]